MFPTGIPVHVEKDKTVRLKVHDPCGLTCNFCHNEGTPVVVDNRRRPLGDFTTAGPSGRVSIYAATNGTTAAELAEVQHARYRDPDRAQRKIDALKRSIAECETHGIKASANIVVLDHSHAPRVHRLLDEYSPYLSVRLLNSLDHGPVSVEAIERILAERGAVAEAHYITAGVSGARTAYRLPDGRRVFFKQIRPVRLPDTCAGCRFNNDTDCQEGFYGVRLYYDRTGRYQVGVCIQRMDLCMPLEEFVTSPKRAEILALRDAEYQRLTARLAG